MFREYEDGESADHNTAGVRVLCQQVLLLIFFIARETEVPVKKMKNATKTT